MKKLFLSLCFAAALTLTACNDEEKEPTLTCEAASTALETAIQNWDDAPSIATCSAAIDAYEDALTACSDLYTPEQLQVLQDGLDEVRALCVE